MEKAFREILEEYEVKLNKTQDEIADIIGISIRMYQFYRPGQYAGTKKRIDKYVTALETYHESLLQERLNIFSEPTCRVLA